METFVLASPQLLSKKYSNDRMISLKLKIEPWAFETLQEYFPNSTETDLHQVRHNLADCIMKFQQVLAGNVLLGTEIMLDFLNGLLIFEVKNYSQTLNYYQIEETYTLDLTKVELN
jgi:hypothetical protein